MFKYLALSLLPLLFMSCASQTADISSPSSVAAVRKIQVVKLASEDRGIDLIIADQLREMGYSATNGPRTAAPKLADALITYNGKSFWDTSMYMTQLDMEVRDPQNDAILASGRSYRPSVQRKSK